MAAAAAAPMEIEREFKGLAIADEQKAPARPPTGGWEPGTYRINSTTGLWEREAVATIEWDMWRDQDGKPLPPPPRRKEYQWGEIGDHHQTVISAYLTGIFGFVNVKVDVATQSAGYLVYGISCQAVDSKNKMTGKKRITRVPIPADRVVSEFSVSYNDKYHISIRFCKKEGLALMGCGGAGIVIDRARIL